MTAAPEAKSWEAKTGMLIRKPVAEVFEALVNPAITSKFWFTKGSGRLEKGQTVRWDWEMYGVHANAKVIELEQNKRIVVEWAAPGQPATTVEWLFTARPDGTTYVAITHTGFKGSADDIVRQALDSTGGFTFHISGLKALLEHGIELNLTGDAHPR